MVASMSGAILLLLGVLVLGAILGNAIGRLLDDPRPLREPELVVPMLMLLTGLTLIAWGLAK